MPDIEGATPRPLPMKPVWKDEVLGRGDGEGARRRMGCRTRAWAASLAGAGPPQCQGGILARWAVAEPTAHAAAHRGGRQGGMHVACGPPCGRGQAGGGGWRSERAHGTPVE